MNILARQSTIDPPVVTRVPEPTPVAAPPPQPHPPEPTRAQVSPSIISAALSVTGRLESAGDIQIDGRIEGDVRGQRVTIGSTAMIKGTVAGEVVELNGTLEGKIEATSVVLAKTAHMSGDIIHRSLKIDQGAYFSGNSRPHAKTAETADVALPAMILAGSAA
jgi:cytoskeletal protein CcmA (bactofilin family)